MCIIRRLLLNAIQEEGWQFQLRATLS